jgi:hypothetical protein
LLTADAFGFTFHRATLDEFEAASRARRLPEGLKISGARVELDGARYEFPGLGEFASVAANATTLAFTTAFTHSIVLVALR